MPLLFPENVFEGIPYSDAQRLIEKMEWLWVHRRLVRHQSLSGSLSQFYKKRVGKYRILYTYDDNADELIVHLVGTRDDIYKRPL
jgi:mRNA-degrading endonuclease RelE of RelBE toxin-antitoxin system